MKVEVRLVHRLEGRNQHRKILGQTAGHDGIDRGTMEGQLKSGRRVARDHRLRGPALVAKRGVHALKGRRNDRQTVGPPFFIAIVDRREQIVGNLVDAGIKWHERLAAFWMVMTASPRSTSLTPVGCQCHLIPRHPTATIAHRRSASAPSSRAPGADLSLSIEARPGRISTMAWHALLPRARRGRWSRNKGRHYHRSAQPAGHTSEGVSRPRSAG